MEQEDQATPIIGEIQVTGYRCRCGHEWASKNLLEGERPRVCPSARAPTGTSLTSSGALVVDTKIGGHPLGGVELVKLRGT